MDTNANVTAEPGTPPPPPAPVAPPPRRLTRRMDQRIIAGVAAGLGDYFGIDPVWVRLGFVVSALLGGAGILVYIALWFIIPPAWGPEPGVAPLPPKVERLARKMDRTPAWVGIVLLVVGGMLLASQVLSWHPTLFWGVVLVVVGVLLFRRPPTLPAAPPPPPGGGASVDGPVAGPVAPPLTAGLVASGPAPVGGVDTEPIPPALPPPLPARRVPVRRERSGLGWITVGVALVALGVVAMLDLAGAFHVTLVQYLALPLTVLGLGMLVGAFVGRARWLVVPALLLVPFVLLASLVRVPIAGGTGSRTFQPATAQQILPVYRMGAGELVIDLRETNLGIQPVTVVATNVAGRILVIVPPGTPLDVHARVGAGDVRLFGQNEDGFRVDVHRTFGSTEASGSPGLLSLDLETSFGQVEVSS